MFINTCMDGRRARKRSEKGRKEGAMERSEDIIWPLKLMSYFS